MRIDRNTGMISCSGLAPDQRPEQMAFDNGYRFQIRLCGRLLELRFSTQMQASLIERSMAGQTVSANEEPDSVFYFWQDDCTRYIETEDPAKGVRYTGEAGSFLYLPQRRLLGADLRNRIFYCCQHSVDTQGDPIPTWFATSLLSLWAQASGLLMLHGAGVGLNGRGVLIAANSGGGKSTLSVSCLLDGMDFAGDDVLLLNEKGPARAMPYYTAVKLNPDMFQVLQPDMPVFFTREDGKLLLDASAHPFCEAIPINAILYPSIAEAPVPIIKPIAPAPVLAELIRSTVQAITMYYSPEFARRAAERLAGIPVYGMYLSGEPHRNASALREFIERMV